MQTLALIDENLLVRYVAQMLQYKQACHMAIGLRGRPLSAQKARQRCFQRETSRPCLPTWWVLHEALQTNHRQNRQGLSKALWIYGRGIGFHYQLWHQVSNGRWTLSVLPTLDWATEISQREEVAVVSGFHSRMEREVLKILLRGKCGLIAFTSTPWAHRAGHFPSMTGQHTSRAISASLSIQRPSTHCISFYSYLIWAIFSPQEYTFSMIQIKETLTFSMIQIEKTYTFSMIHALSSPEKMAFDTP